MTIQLTSVIIQPYRKNQIEKTHQKTMTTMTSIVSTVNLKQNPIEASQLIWAIYTRKML